MYCSLPVLGFLVWYYGWRIAGRSLALGVFAAGGLVTILYVVVDGADPPPGFGISGVPLGGSAVAGCTSLLLHFLASGYGYRKNEQLGDFLGRATAFATLAVGGGISPLRQTARDRKLPKAPRDPEQEPMLAVDLEHRLHPSVESEGQSEA